jgi:hypothetical protein
MLRPLCLVSSFFLLSSIAWGSCPLQDGDLVFIKSQTEQAKLLKITTGSEWSHVGMAFKNPAGWEIIEAVQPVKWSSLYSFVRRSHQLSFEVLRSNQPFDPKKVKSYASSQLGKNYDLIFAWDNERWYCSELVYKAYKKASSVELGEMELIGDLKNIDRPEIRKEAKKRFEQYGLEYNHEKWKESPVITPVQMMRSSNLNEVVDSSRINELVDCLK